MLQLACQSCVMIIFLACLLDGQLIEHQPCSECQTLPAQADQESIPESTYQAQFDTVDSEWTTVSLPWHEFVPVKRAQVLLEAQNPTS